VISSDSAEGPAAAQPPRRGSFDARAAQRLREAFERSIGQAMLIVDDQRRWVTGNAAACELFGIGPDELPWHSMDDFTAPSERERLDQQWHAFLRSGAAEGRYQLYFPDRGAVPVEFSATANVLPARHLSVFIPPEASPESMESNLTGEDTWRPVVVEGVSRSQLTEREREVLKLIASGLQSAEISERLFVSPETIKSHVHNALGKLGARTRAHAVAIALVTGQISSDI
jgi:PAS domain S-box-containing protein